MHALATPLITKPDGTKYGKTEGGAIWLSPDLMSPYAFYQFWLNVADAEVPGLLRVFTFRSREEIEDLERQTAERPAARAGAARAGRGPDHAGARRRRDARAIAASRALFGQGDLPSSTSAPWPTALAEVPHAEVFLRDPRRGAAARGRPDGARPASSPSKSAARRAIAEGGAYLNNTKVTDAGRGPVPGRPAARPVPVLRRGKRTVGAVEVGRWPDVRPAGLGRSRRRTPSQPAEVIPFRTVCGCLRSGNIPYAAVKL